MLSCPTKLFQQIPGRDSLSDVVLGELLSGRTKDTSATFQASARERNISRDDDVPGLHALDNAIIGRIEPFPYNLERNPLFVWSPHPGVGHQCDIKTISAGDAIHLLFDRARISINKDVEQRSILQLLVERKDDGLQLASLVGFDLLQANPAAHETAAASCDLPITVHVQHGIGNEQVFRPACHDSLGPQSALSNRAQQKNIE